MTNLASHIVKTKLFHEDDYREQGLKAQRNYPNEELCRFMGGRFFGIPRNERKDIKIMETGCGSGANLWMIADEGFDAYGLDLSAEGVALCNERLKSKGLTATLECASMTHMPFEDNMFDAVIDVFSSHCLDLKNKELYFAELKRVLKPGGFFFSYHPAKGSDAFKDHAPSVMIDACTLNGIYRETSPYYKYENTYCFLTPQEYEDLCKPFGLNKIKIERIGRTYRNEAEYFEFVSAVFQKSH